MSSTTKSPTNSWTAIGLVARRTWRARWPQHLLLSGVVAVSVAVVFAVLVGADRSTTAMDRLRAATHASDVALSGGEPEGQLLESVTDSTGVMRASEQRELFALPERSDLLPDFTLLSVAPGRSTEGVAVDVPIIVDGRAPDQAAIVEVAMSERLAADLDLQVGDQVTIESQSDEWVDVAYNGGDPGPPDGPEVRAKLVGLARSPADFTRYHGVLHLTSAYADRYQGDIREYTFVVAAVSSALRRQLAAGKDFAAGNVDQIDVGPSPNGRSSAVQDSLDTIAAALRLVAAIAAMAGLALIGLVATRAARDAVTDRSMLVAIGWTKAEVARLAGITLIPAMVAGVVVGLASGAVASPFTLTGLAAAVDPAGRALVVGPALFLVVLLGTTVLLMVLVAVTARRVRRPGRSAPPAAASAPPIRRPIAIGLGMHRALFGGPGSGGRVSRSATVAVVLGVSVATAALIIGASIEQLQLDPSLSGQGGGQKVIDAGEDLEVFQRVMATVEPDERVVDLVGYHVAFGVQGPGAVDLPAMVLDRRRGEVEAGVLQGRLPVRSDEVAVGPASLERMGVGVGGEIELEAAGETARFEIVGAMLFPEGDFSYDAGVAMTVEGARFLGGVDATAIHQIRFAWGPGVDTSSADEELTAAGFTLFPSTGGLVPASVSNLGEVRSLAAPVAGLALVLGLVTALYALAVTGRLRRRETATLRALGLSTGAAWSAAEAQGVIIALIGVLAGMPFGVVLGRQVWSLIVDRSHLIDRPVVSPALVAWCVGVTVVGTVVLAIPLAMREARQRPAAVLRSE